jgi:4-diphosphocytidyl-2-C-methyl-D-erythritol kinase
MQQQALAKLNLTLDVLGRREDGYHDMCMVMQSITLADTLTIKPTTGEGIRVSTNFEFLPSDDTNLAAKAAKAFWDARGEAHQALEIDIDKHIPVCAGMAGGSSDAAAVLRGLNEQAGKPYTLMELAKVGEAVGSDVPYCVLGGTALAEGRGEILTPLAPLPKCHVVVCKPGFPISTPTLFRKIDQVDIVHRPDTAGMIAALEAGDLTGVARRLYNVFEDALNDQQRASVNAIKNTLIEYGALGAAMSGSGPTVFGLFDDEEKAKKAYQILSKEYRESYLAQSV